MTTDEMLIEIIQYDYKSYGFPYVFMSYSKTWNVWNINWRNPVSFVNEKQAEGSTPNEACNNAMKFIKDNPKMFKKIKTK